MTKKQGTLNFEALNEVLLQQVGELLLAWLPGGKMVSNTEFGCGDLSGGPGKSLMVNTKTGKWCDFATGEKGGDLISLYAAVFGKNSMKDAFWELKNAKGIHVPLNKVKKVIDNDDPKYYPAPEGTEPPEFQHKKRDPQKVYTYLNENKEVLFYIARYQQGVSGKEFIPYSWNGRQWVKKIWPAPRPMYGLWRLKDSKRPVLICEGEKAADAARQLMGSVYDVVSWPGGAQAVSKIDWKPLYGRSILLWPDADRQAATTIPQCTKYNVDQGDLLPRWAQPGIKAMLDIAKILDDECQLIKLIDVPFDDPFAQYVPGFDAADALADEWSYDDVVAWARPYAKPIEMGRHPDEPDKKPPPYFPSATGESLPSITTGTSASHDDIKTAEILPPHESVPDPTDEDAPIEFPRNQIVIWEELGLVCTKTGAPIANVDNMMRILENYEQLKNLCWYDEFHQKIYTEWNYGRTTPKRVREWEDTDDIKLNRYIQRFLGIRNLRTSMVREAVEDYATGHVRNEPKEWMETLEWDGVERVYEFFPNYFGTQNVTEYHRAVSKNFWVSMVARTFRPGCKCDEMIILEGAQGVYKSTALNVIAGKWFAEATESPSSKDFYQSLQGCLIMEIGELDVFDRHESETIKRVLSCRSDRFRPPYGRKTQEFPRRCIFAGTTNKDEYLKDETGGRRFLPIKVGVIDLVKLKQDRDQLFAEAIHLFKSGTDWHGVPKELTREQQALRSIQDDWLPVIQSHVTMAYSDSFTTMQIAKEALEIEPRYVNRMTSVRISKIMKDLGWEYKKMRSGGRQYKGWRRPAGGNSDAVF